MKTFSKFILIFLFISLTPKNLHSQDSIQYRKLYLHTDREQYFQGDTIWYKAYYLDGQTTKFIPGLITMYVDLINEEGELLLDQIVPIDDGTSDGAINLPANLEPGNYTLRAFTDYQRTMGEEAFFYRQVIISKLESFTEGAENPTKVDIQQMDIAFLPEGGVLLEGRMNTVGIKAIDTLGLGVSVQGEIISSEGGVITAFNTNYKGMTSFKFLPQKNETYIARLLGFPDYKYTFDNIVEEGIKIEYDRETDNSISIYIVTNAESLLAGTFYFAISHFGKVIYHEEFVLMEDIFEITIDKNELPAGINRLVLLDEKLQPLSERLFFSANYETNELEVTTDKQVYETRSRVQIDIADDMDMDIKSWSNLSMAVVDELSLDKANSANNILSWLLIDSEIKGHVESPLDFFKDTEGIPSATKLDLLMITQGWSSYIWSNPKELIAHEYEEEDGFSLSGRITKKLSDKPATEGTVELKVYNNDFIHMDEDEIDEDGRFKFTDISFMDTASVFVQARNKRENLAFEVSLDSLFEDFPSASAEYLPREQSGFLKQAGLYQKQYDNLQALKEYTLKTGRFYLDEVSIIERKRERDDGHFRLYPKPTASKELTESDIAYNNVFDYIRGRFSGVTVSSNNVVIIRGIGTFQGEEKNGALLLLDGLPVNKNSMVSVPMSDIDKVEVLKNPSETAIFGINGGNGVVSVFTKKGSISVNSEKYLPGTIAKKIRGYSTQRKFYSPKYTPETIASEKPDHRMLLYWNPNIFTKSWEAAVSFFTSDDISRYKVFVEGITSEGEICLGTTSFEVASNR